MTGEIFQNIIKRYQREKGSSFANMHTSSLQFARFSNNTRELLYILFFSHKTGPVELHDTGKQQTWLSSLRQPALCVCDVSQSLNQNVEGYIITD